MVAGILEAKFKYCTWFDCVGSQSRTKRPLNGLELVNFQRYALNHKFAYDDDMRTGFKYSELAYEVGSSHLNINYAGQYNCNSKMRYKITGPTLPADYTIENFAAESRYLFATMQN